MPKIDGFSFSFSTAAENMVINQIFYCDLIEHEGKHYVNITNARTKTTFEDYSLKVESETVIPLITEIMIQVLNVNWRLFFTETESQWEKILDEIIQSLVTPIFEKIAIQDFFQ